MKFSGLFCRLVLSLLLLFTLGCQAKDKETFLEARQAFDNGQFDEAIAGFLQVIQNYPTSQFREESLFHIGSIYYKYIKNPEKAIEYYSLLITSYPDSIYICDLRLNIGDLYMKRFEEYDKAIEEYQKVIVHCADPEQKAFAQLRIADCYFETVKYRQALIEYKLFETDYTFSSNKKTAFKKIADCSYILGDMINAEIYYRKTLDILSDNDQKEAVKISLAQLLLNTGEACMAAEIFHELLDQQPKRSDLELLAEKSDQECAKKSGKNQPK